MENQAETIITGSESGDALAVGIYGQGTVIHWNMGGHYGGSDIWSDHVRLLLANIVQFGIDQVPK